VRRLVRDRSLDPFWYLLRAAQDRFSFQVMSRPARLHNHEPEGKESLHFVYGLGAATYPPHSPRRGRPNRRPPARAGDTTASPLPPRRQAPSPEIVRREMGIMAVRCWGEIIPGVAAATTGAEPTSDALSSRDENRIARRGRISRQERAGGYGADAAAASSSWSPAERRREGAELPLHFSR